MKPHLTLVPNTVDQRRCESFTLEPWKVQFYMTCGKVAEFIIDASEMHAIKDLEPEEKYVYQGKAALHMICMFNVTAIKFIPVAHDETMVAPV